jgi:hypothetical protein
VVFKNNASIPLSILAEGLTYLTDFYMPSGNASVTSASSVLPGTTLRTVWAYDPLNAADVSLSRVAGDQHTYVWRARAGPTSDSDPSSSIWRYAPPHTRRRTRTRTRYGRPLKE